jgi:hypothetical protein
MRTIATAMRIAKMRDVLVFIIVSPFFVFALSCGSALTGQNYYSTEHFFLATLLPDLFLEKLAKQDRSDTIRETKEWTPC